MDDAREVVRSTAKYLRSVRPIDPAELAGYVPGDRSPAAVRELLQDEAPTIGLIERSDGTFGPVPEGPLPPVETPVRRFPADHGDRLESWLTDRYGSDYASGESGDRIRAAIRAFKRAYFTGNAPEYADYTVAGYAIYHLPAYYATIQYPLAQLVADGLLDHSLTVLDIGAGVGGPALGLFDACPQDCLIRYHAVEPAESGKLLETLLATTGSNVHTRLHRTPIESFDPATVEGSMALSSGDIDLVLACNVLSELEDPVAVLERAMGWLAPDGTLLGMSPADRRASIALRRHERAIEDRHVDGDRVCVYGPTVRLWPDERPTDRGWSFDVRPEIAVPSFQRRLDREAADGSTGEYVNIDVQFSYTLLRRDGRRRVEVTLAPDQWARMADMDRHVTNRIDCVAAKLSHSLAERGDGANPLYKVSDGSERCDHYAVCMNETTLNRTLRTAEYGDVLAFENTLVLWNDDEEGYNLIVDDETVVDHLA